MPHIISSRVTQYQAQVITGVTICRKFINSLIILTSSLNHGALGIGHWERGGRSCLILNFELISPSSALAYPFHQYFNSELVNS